jgi:DNA invertase Pin-like site-specific DNA recombinase
MDKQKYVIYLRVSTKRQGSSGLGLDAQRKMCTDLIERENGVVAKEFQDVESGKSRTRPGLWQAIDYCKVYGCTLVIAKLDRLARDVEFTFKVIGTGIQIRFVDMPVMNTMILGVFASVAQYERELIVQRTKGALEAIKDDIEKNGGHVSRTGRYIKRLGREKGADTSAAGAAAGLTHSRKAENWRDGSALYLWVTNQLLKGKSRKAIVAEAIELYEKNPALYGTRNGKPLCEGTLSRWAREISAD